MITTALRSNPAPSFAVARDRVCNDPAFGAFLLLRIGFAVLPLWMGIDKFLNKLTYWPHYLAPWITDLLPFTAQTAMYVVGAIEVVAGFAVAIKPRYASYIVAAWLAGIIVNLLTYPGFYDVALRDFGLLLGALTLARLASVYDPSWFRHSTAARAR
ncbi:DoxX family membrane protein [Skermania sp. ID1734]|uniref:DoxX family membrane protein n=1 Tax=Skermania sp. ID1734 TaxID=2597516 RepID=UPI00117CDFE6|nr:DoxX family membrane protein [Skermania sp. ID1734]TSD99190.1 DoxX family membrane protein [Skermania sp. ID1734]